MSSYDTDGCAANRLTRKLHDGGKSNEISIHLINFN